MESSRDDRLGVLGEKEMCGADFDQEWQVLNNELLNGMREWRLQHPQATLSAMERALDKRMAQLRAKMLQDMALASKNADLSQVPPAVLGGLHHDYSWRTPECTYQH